eukprot:Em0446g3a
MEKMKAWTRKLMGSTDNLAARRDSSQNDGQADSHTTQYGATSLKIRRLVDSRQYQGVINLLRDHTSDYLSHCLSTFPFQALNQGVPDTLPIWETLLAKLHRNEDGYIPSFPYAACDELVFQISYVLEVHKGNPDGNPSTIATCKRVLKKVYMLYGDILERLYVQHAKTEKAIHSLALHLPLGMDHDAVSLLSTIRREVVACLQDYHEAEERLGELTKNEQVSLLDILEQGMEKNVDLPEIAAIPLDLTHSQCFNQIQLQERLYFNQCVRAALQPNRRRDNLVQLMEMLNDRITGDKEVLALYGAVRQRYQQITDDEPVIMWLKKHQHALECTISVLKDIEKDLSINTKRSSVDPFPLPPLLPVPVPSPFSSPTDTQVTLLISDDLHDTPVQSDANSRRVSVASIECDQWKDSEGETALPSSDWPPQASLRLSPQTPQDNDPTSSIHDLHSTAKEHTPNLAFTRVQSLNSRPVVAGLKKKLGFGFLPSSLNNLPVTQHSSLKAKKKMFRSGSGGVVNSTKHASEVSGDCTSLQLLQEELDSMNKELREAKEMIQELRKHERELTDSHCFLFLGSSGFPSKPSVSFKTGYQELYSQGRVEASDAIEDLDLADDPQFILDLLLQTLLVHVVTNTPAFDSLHLNRCAKLCLQHSTVGSMQTASGMEGHPGCGGNRQPPSSEAAGVCCQSLSQESVLSVQHRGHRTGVKKKLHTQYAEKGCATITQIFDVGAYLAYIEECVRVSWELCVQSPAMTLNCSEKHFDADFHLRFHSAEMTSSLINRLSGPPFCSPLDPRVSCSKEL